MPTEMVILPERRRSDLQQPEFIGEREGGSGEGGNGSVKAAGKSGGGKRLALSVESGYPRGFSSPLLRLGIRIFWCTTAL